jgi:hypothetical protein
MKRPAGERGCTAHIPEELYIRFTTVPSDCTNRVNVYDKGKNAAWLVVSLAATIFC